MDRFDLASKRILVVEDDFLLAEYPSLLLHTAGALPVGPASSEPTALDPCMASRSTRCVSPAEKLASMTVLKEQVVPFIVIAVTRAPLCLRRFAKSRR